MKTFRTREQRTHSQIEILGYEDAAVIAKILAMNNINVRVNLNLNRPNHYDIQIETWTEISEEIETELTKE